MLTKILLRRISTATKQKRLGVLGVPFTKGQSKDGTQLTPDLLHERGLIQHLKKSSYDQLAIKNYGNLEFCNAALDTDIKAMQNMKNFPDFVNCNQALITRVQEILNENDEILTIGGDHSIGFGSVAGHLQHTPNLSVVWIDAHADINISTSSGSGHIHGMPVSLLLAELRAHWENMLPLAKMAPVCLPLDQLIYIGLRDVEPYETYLLKKFGIRAFDMNHIDKYGINKITEMTLDAINPKNKIHISFDIDALDSLIAPATGTPVHAGMTLREAVYVINALRQSNRVEGFDLVEINPKLGTTQDVNRTIDAAFELLRHMYAPQLDVAEFENKHKHGIS